MHSDGPHGDVQEGRRSLDVPPDVWGSLRSGFVARLVALSVAGLAGCGSPKRQQPQTPATVALRPATPTMNAPGEASVENPVQTESNDGSQAEEGLARKWELKEVRYADGRPPFTPQNYGGVTLDRHGNVWWTDGCNRMNATYGVFGDQIQISDVESTLVYCEGQREPVDYASVVRVELDGRQLQLFTPTQTYVLERFAYSRMSEHAWSLSSITEIATGETLNVDRFRTDYRHLLLRVVEDATFEFTDLDMRKFSGTLEVTAPSAIRLDLDGDSLARIRQRGTRRGRLTDSTVGYKKTKKLYPTTYAQEVAWDAIETFEVFEQPVEVMGQRLLMDVLDLRSKTHQHRFLPR